MDKQTHTGRKAVNLQENLQNHVSGNFSVADKNRGKIPLQVQKITKTGTFLGGVMDKIIAHRSCNFPTAFTCR